MFSVAPTQREQPPALVPTDPALWRRETAEFLEDANKAADYVVDTNIKAESHPVVKGDGGEGSSRQSGT